VTTFVTSTIVPFDGPSVADAGGPVLYDANSNGGGWCLCWLQLSPSLTTSSSTLATLLLRVMLLLFLALTDPNAGRHLRGKLSQSYIAQLSYLSPMVSLNGALVYQGSGYWCQLLKLIPTVVWSASTSVASSSAGYYAEHEGYRCYRWR
jgi:hypothetical protein